MGRRAERRRHAATPRPRPRHDGDARRGPTRCRSGSPPPARRHARRPRRQPPARGPAPPDPRAGPLISGRRHLRGRSCQRHAPGLSRSGGAPRRTTGLDPDHPADPRRRAVHGADGLDGDRDLAAGDRRRHRHLAGRAQARRHLLSRRARDLHPDLAAGCPTASAPRTSSALAIVVFILGSIACAFANSIHAFVLSRFLQGIGGSMMTPGRAAPARPRARRATSSSRRWPG